MFPRSFGHDRGAVCMIAMLSTGCPAVAVAVAAELDDARSQRSEVQVQRGAAKGVPRAVCRVPVIEVDLWGDARWRRGCCRCC